MPPALLPLTKPSKAFSAFSSRLLFGASLLLGSTLLVSCQPPDGRSSGAPAREVGAGRIVVAGGTLVTFDAAGRVIADGAVAIVDDRIAAIGPTAEILAAYPGAERIEADGGIIMPGLINAHTHAPMVLFRGLADDLELMDWLENHIFPAEARYLDDEFVRWGTRLACLEMLRGGITTFVDMYLFEDAVAEEADRCGIRAVLGQNLIDFPTADHATWDEALAGTRSFLQRWSSHPRIVPAVAPHAPYTVSREHLVQAHALAREFDAPMIIHLSEVESELERVRQASGNTPIALLEELGILDDRVIAAHVVWPTEDEVSLLAQREVGVAHCPQSNMKLAAGVAPIPHLIDAGIAVGIGTDGAGSNNDLDIWDEVDTAAKLHKVFSGDPTVMDARQAISMATIGGARAIDMDDRIGSLEVGKKADLIVVRTDGLHQQPQRPDRTPYSLLVYATKAADVTTVIVDGQVVVRDGEVLTLDQPEILAHASAYRDDMAASL